MISLMLITYKKLLFLIVLTTRGLNNSIPSIFREIKKLMSTESVTLLLNIVMNREERALEAIAR